MPTEAQNYDEYQQAKEAIASAVQSMKRAGGDMGFDDSAIQEDIKEVLDENGVDVSDWMI